MAELLEAAIPISMASHLQIAKHPRSGSCFHHQNLSKAYPQPFISSPSNLGTRKLKSQKPAKHIISAASCGQSPLSGEPLSPPLPINEAFYVNSGSNCCDQTSKKQRVFFLDVNPLCYKGSTPSIRAFAHWVSLFFSEVSLNDPVIAVLDGDRCNEYRKELLPSYKANRRKIHHKLRGGERFSRDSFGRLHKLVVDFLRKSSVPVVQIEGHEADDVIATLVHQVLSKGYRSVIASPDKDFKQLISEHVQIVAPLPELGRWSFYTLKHYMAQYNCNPQSDLSLRCILGDEVDGVPGIQHLVPGFGRKTALKLLKKHGSLESLLAAARVRSVGRRYAQEALTNYADFLCKNYQVLSLKRDVNVQIEDEWLCTRDQKNDSINLSKFMEFVNKKDNL